ncbi:MAG: dTDP-4-dehydrorhamnose reductase [Bacteroidales bacterium]|jgi:dTDP-4-dehydrorhamnose reductase|nr:dTDP-4-dehydrorhamnose reductase [Bacteroidales bacterium]
MEKEIVLVTGANGQLGQCIRKVSLQHQEYDYLFTDVEELNITSSEAIKTFLQQNKVNAIINAAAYTAVDKAETDIETSDLINNVAAGYLAVEAARYGIKLIHISTDYVFNGNKNTPYSTDDKPIPETVYGKTKLKGEQAVLKHIQNVVILRTSWLYSEYGGNFVKTMLNLGRQNKEINVVFDQTGSPTYAMDLAEFAVRILDRISGQRIVHYSNEGVCSWYDFARKIMLYADLDCRVKPVLSSEYPKPAPRPHYSVLDKSYTKAFYDIDIPHWEDSLMKCVNNLIKG